MAHKPSEETRASVRALAAFGTPQEDIGKYIGISHVTLRKHYAAELDVSSIKANAKVGEFLFSMASGDALKKGASYGDCSRAAIFWAKTRMKWRETDTLELTGKDGGPIQTEDVSARDILSSRLAGIAARTGKTDRSGEPD